MTPITGLLLSLAAGYAAGATCTAAIVLMPGGLVDPKTMAPAHKVYRWTWARWTIVLALWPAALAWWSFNARPSRP